MKGHVKDTYVILKVLIEAETLDLEDSYLRRLQSTNFVEKRSKFEKINANEARLLNQY